MPKMDTKSMMRGGMSAANKDLLSAVSHMAFRTRLIRRCAKTTCKLWTVSEYLSTRLCSHCGRMSSVGRARTFRCSNQHCTWGAHTTSSRDTDASLAIWRLNFGEVVQRVLQRASGGAAAWGVPHDDDDDGAHGGADVPMGGAAGGGGSDDDDEDDGGEDGGGAGGGGKGQGGQGSVKVEGRQSMIRAIRMDGKSCCVFL